MMKKMNLVVHQEELVTSFVMKDSPWTNMFVIPWVQESPPMSRHLWLLLLLLL
jgi:hypothetical protein